MKFDLASSMHKELVKQGSETPDLVKAAKCLHAALEILKAHGLTARAVQVQKLLHKFAQMNDARDVMQMPTRDALMDAGLTEEDMAKLAKGNPYAKARFNVILREVFHMSDHQIGQFIGKTNVMSESEAKQIAKSPHLGKFHDWMNDPTQPVDPRNPQPGEVISLKRHQVTGPGDTISFQSMKEPLSPSKDDLTFKSMASPDRHTNGLTSEKMVKNLENHGTVFNMADAPPLDMNNLKESDFEDGFGELASLLNDDLSDSDDVFSVDINDTLEVSEKDIPMDDFEDERD